MIDIMKKIREKRKDEQFGRNSSSFAIGCIITYIAYDAIRNAINAIHRKGGDQNE